MSNPYRCTGTCQFGKCPTPHACEVPELNPDPSDSFIASAKRVVTLVALCVALGYVASFFMWGGR